MYYFASLLKIVITSVPVYLFSVLIYYTTVYLCIAKAHVLNSSGVKKMVGVDHTERI